MGDIKGYVLENGLVPSILEYNVMRLMREKYGHVGIDKCTNEMKRYYWFSNMRDKLCRFIRNCLKCLYSAPHQKKNKIN